MPKIREIPDDLSAQKELTLNCLMITEIRQLRVTDENDLLSLNSFTLQLTQLLSLSVPEQIKFAAMIVGHCNPVFGINNVTFSLERRENERNFLLVRIENPFQKTEKRLELFTIGHDLLPDLPLTLIAQEKLPHRLQDVEQFSFALSHELKTALTKLQLAVSLLEKEELTTRVSKFVRIIKRSSNSIETTLMDLNRVLELGHDSQRVVQKLSLQKIINEVKDEFADKLVQIQATVTIDTDPDDEFTYNGIYLRTILSNLISNSIKYAHPSRPLQLSIAAVRSEHTLILTLIDNGQGIDLNLHGKKLFQPFTRFSNKAEGTGNGLYLVKKMIERNSGSIEVESKIGHGTTFRCYLPQYVAHAASLESLSR